MFGCAGTSTPEGYGEAPFPQIRAVVVTGRAGRAALGAITGRARAGEQALLARLIRRRRELFTGRVFCFDRNFRAPRGALVYRPRSGHGLEEVSVGLMAYLDP